MKFEAIFKLPSIVLLMAGLQGVQTRPVWPSNAPHPSPECPARLQVPFTLSDLLACYQISRAWPHPTGFNCLHFIPGGSSLNNHLNSRSRAGLGPIQSGLLLGSSTAPVAHQLWICGPAPLHFGATSDDRGGCRDFWTSSLSTLGSLVLVRLPPGTTFSCRMESFLGRT